MILSTHPAEGGIPAADITGDLEAEFMGRILKKFVANNFPSPYPPTFFFP
jgi:hypothetical protein